jgi:hypothetical protein
MAGKAKLFDEYEDEDNGYGAEEEVEGPTHLDDIRRIFVESKLEIPDEDCDKTYDTILILESGIKMGFDEEGKLKKIWND